MRAVVLCTGKFGPIDRARLVDIVGADCVPMAERIAEALWEKIKPFEPDSMWVQTSADRYRAEVIISGYRGLMLHDRGWAYMEDLA